ADLVVINKADIDPAAATRARAQIQSALRVYGQQGNPQHALQDASIWHPEVIQISGLKGEGLDRFWDCVSRFRTLQTASSRLQQRRQQQSLAWMWERIDAGLKAAFRAHPGVREALPAMTQAVGQGQLAPSTAARRLLALAAPETAA
ncbi:MAG TPA: methylmalonyl Co-A mutase-associated GTPase MeaB, partial [Ottowia sp.]|nr:methylmalonyl Co-A mutase-associated GTPase MeaB [Ottowia sp.]